MACPVHLKLMLKWRKRNIDDLLRCADRVREHDPPTFNHPLYPRLNIGTIPKDFRILLGYLYKSNNAKPIK